MSDDKKIVVLGGGTAGWMTALFCRQTFASVSITVIENTSLGTIGVGQGTTTGFTGFLNLIGLDEYDVMKESGGSVKNGISFENWNGDNKKYFHSFNGEYFTMPSHPDENCEKYYIQKVVKEGLDLNEYTYAAKLSYQNEIDVHYLPVSMHMDASKLGTYLRNVGEERNIVCVDGNFSHVEVDENNFIQKLCLDDGRDVECDFVFDCSGFAKLLIGKYYKVPWISYKDYLPMKKAIAFPLESEKEVKPYTQAIAMKYGWMWKIPVQDRIGAGYVFDSDYLTDEEAIDEVQQFLGQTISNVRSIPFESGRHEQFWVKNCIAIGLASNFIEPLEATSLDAVIGQLALAGVFNLLLDHMFTYDEKSVSRYNETIAYALDVITHFIYLHYLTKRNDSEFWETFKQRHPPPQKFERLLQLIYENNFSDFDLPLPEILDLDTQIEALRQDSPFSVIDYLTISHGLELVKQPINTDDYENLTPSVAEYKKMMDSWFDTPNVISHTDFLAGLYGSERVGSPLYPPCYCEPGFPRRGQ